MEKVSGRIWLLIAGIAVAIAIAVSALAIDRKVLPTQASEPAPQKTKTLPAILLKSIYSVVEAPLKKAK